MGLKIVKDSKIRKYKGKFIKIGFFIVNIYLF